MNIPKQREVNVLGETFAIWIVKTGASTWRAYGECHSKDIDKTGKSEQEAISSWKSAASAIIIG